ncbi:ribosome silencing factor [Anaplasma phagocytophilum]|uniref:Ribosomal silencing factor RsfS n=2 Tax=Anaplasma phagocytophilum TaxID=948 RepID=A0A0F3NIT2_ANAPH|nr:ribosome silencing factor [Anaplasma phagocytophilum]KJV65004.1 oligomerization domain protein [Anaplasma phagocytophilum str. ApMUC09]KJV66814.1 oligomerization domain protein [Anaplasma phagocytophilum str. ApNP]SBO30757.1 Ribosomal silencing factor RsfS [Anaplasma phagocytophilum]SBO31262.1 Ribosomal silencing factor RsfS [Anaplasma phagocytophilum]SBO33507.1 Ribosomal silencing factor RsfS [Anaplasma phagocytophilum]
MFTSTENLKDLVVAVLDEHSARDIAALDVRDRCQLTEYIIVSSGNSTSHVKALAEHVKKKVAHYSKKHIEGLDEGNWVVITLNNVIVHIFREEVREYYKLEDLWSKNLANVNLVQGEKPNDVLDDTL